ncbi:MAG: hypothetical protein QXD62_02485 [Candidatus Woesearchaeota archaeon]
MDITTLETWFESNLKHKYIDRIESFKKQKIGKNILFTMKLKEKKTSFSHYKECEKIYALILDPSEIPPNADYFVFPFNKQSSEFLIKNPNFVEKNKIILINPKSIPESEYPINRLMLDEINEKEIEKFLKKIQEYIKMI